MSSSRSIAAARQRRAGEAPPVAQRGPGTSMGSQQAFAQQQMQQQMQQPQNKNALPPQAPQVPVGKLSLGDAFALVTIRLGRIETIIQKLEAEGVIGENAQAHSSTMEHDENMRLVDDTVIRNIITRLGDLEKSYTKLSGQVQSKEGMTANEVYSIIDNKTSEIQNQMQNDLLSLNFGLSSEEVSALVGERIGELQEKLATLQTSVKLGLNIDEVTSIVLTHVNEVKTRMDELQNELKKPITSEAVSSMVSQSENDMQTKLDKLQSELNDVNVGFAADADEIKNQIVQLKHDLNEAKDMIEKLSASSEEKIDN